MSCVPTCSRVELLLLWGYIMIRFVDVHIFVLYQISTSWYIKQVGLCSLYLSDMVSSSLELRAIL